MSWIAPLASWIAPLNSPGVQRLHPWRRRRKELFAPHCQDRSGIEGGCVVSLERPTTRVVSRVIVGGCTGLTARNNPSSTPTEQHSENNVPRYRQRDRPLPAEWIVRDGSVQGNRPAT